MSQFCPQCGEKVTDDANFCTACGFKLHNDSILASKSKIKDNIDNNKNLSSSDNLNSSSDNYNDFSSGNYENSTPQIVKKENVDKSEDTDYVMTKKEEKIHKLESKFGVDLTNNPWFECTLEELRESTFRNDTQREVNTGYVIIYDNYIEIVKESVFIKSDMGHRKVYFENVTSIDYDKRGKFHLSNSVMINTKSVERPIQLKYVSENNYNLLLSYFEKYLENKNNNVNNVNNVNNEGYNQFSPADELMKYAQLYKDGFLTKEEFEAKKKELL